MGTTMAQHQLDWLASRLQEVRARIDARRAGWMELAAVKRPEPVSLEDLIKLVPDLLRNPSRVDELSPKQLAGLAAVLSAMTTAVLARSVASAVGRAEPTHEVTEPGPDRLLTAKEAADLLNVTPRWLYRRQLPFARLSRRAVRFSEAGLRRWLTRQNAAISAVSISRDP